jgi:putative ABC transport system permease protein
MNSRMTGVLISLGTAILAVFLGVREILGITPAMAMRQPEPKAGRNLRLPVALEQKLRVQTRIGMRSMGRHPFRGFLIVLAVMFAFSLSSALFSFKPLYDELLKGQFEDIQVYDIQLTLDRFVTPRQAEDAGTVLDGAEETEAVCQTAVALRNGNLTDYTLLYGLDQDSHLYRIRDNDGVFYKQPGDGIIINRRTAEDLHVKEGDYVELMGTGLTNGFVRIRVTQIISELIGKNCYVSLDSFPRLFQSDPMANTILLRTSPEHMDDLRRKLMDTSRVSWIVDTAKIVAAYQSMFGSMLYMIDMFALLSVAAGAILIYNISMISLKERYTEIGTLKVLGMTRREQGSMLLTEKMIYFILGSLLGFPGSYGINRLLEVLIISDSFDLKLHVTPRIYALTALICFLMVMCAWYAEQRLVRRIELTEILKARE